MFKNTELISSFVLYMQLNFKYGNRVLSSFGEEGGGGGGGTNFFELAELTKLSSVVLF